MFAKMFTTQSADANAIGLEAFDMAIEELRRRRPDLLSKGELPNTLVSAIVDLAAAGQTDPVALAGYAVFRARATYG